MKSILYLLLFVFVLSNTVCALPYLQLDVSDGIYDSSSAEETVMATTETFDLIGLIDNTDNPEGDYDNNGNLINEEIYYISIAIVNAPDEDNPTSNVDQNDNFDFGSFEFNSTTYTINSTSSQFTTEVIKGGKEYGIEYGTLTYGTPPVEDSELNDVSLPSSSTFPTYYFVVPFTFGENSTYGNAKEYGTVESYNVDPNADQPTTGSLSYAKFDVDVSTLNETYALHFDFFTIGQKNNGDLQIDDKAPNSHDAQSTESGGNEPPGSAVPEPATLMLLGIGLIFLSRFNRQKIK